MTLRRDARSGSPRTNRSASSRRATAAGLRRPSRGFAQRRRIGGALVALDEAAFGRPASRAATRTRYLGFSGAEPGRAGHRRDDDYVLEFARRSSTPTRPIRTAHDVAAEIREVDVVDVAARRPAAGGVRPMPTIRAPTAASRRSAGSASARRGSPRHRVRVPGRGSPARASTSILLRSAAPMVALTDRPLRLLPPDDVRPGTVGRPMDQRVRRVSDASSRVRRDRARRRPRVGRPTTLHRRSLVGERLTASTPMPRSIAARPPGPALCGSSSIAGRWRGHGRGRLRPRATSSGSRSAFVIFTWLPLILTLRRRSPGRAIGGVAEQLPLVGRAIWSCSSAGPGAIYLAVASVPCVIIITLPIGLSLMIRVGPS